MTAPLSRATDQAGDPQIVAPGPIIVGAIWTASLIAFPRSAAILVMLPVAAVLLNGLRRPATRPRLVLEPLTLAVVAFAAFALLSALWSLDRHASLTKPLYALTGAVAMASALDVVRRSPACLRRYAIGAIAGWLAATAVLAFEAATGQAVGRWLMTKLPVLQAGYEKHLVITDGIVASISEANINRRTTIVTLAAIPVLMLAAGITAASLRRRVIAAIVTVLAVLMIATGHQSSQAAVLAAVMAFALTWMLPRLSRPLIGAAWVASCLAMVPLVSKLHDAGLHANREMVFHSARHRVVIWNTTAEEVKKQPWLGIGADATASRTSSLEKSKLVARDDQFEASTARHAHNTFLQVWYELGAIGAVLFALIGLAALVTMSPVRPVLTAQFAALAAMIAFSFSIWQLWFQGALMLGIAGPIVAGFAARSGSEADEAAMGPAARSAP